MSEFFFMVSYAEPRLYWHHSFLFVQTIVKFSMSWDISW
jgi:hypothetical protein